MTETLEPGEGMTPEQEADLAALNELFGHQNTHSDTARDAGEGATEGEGAAGELCPKWAEFLPEMVGAAAERIAPNWQAPCVMLAEAWAPVFDKYFKNPGAGKYKEEIRAVIVSLAAIEMMRSVPPRGESEQPSNGKPVMDMEPIAPGKPAKDGATVGSVRSG